MMAGMRTLRVLVAGLALTLGVREAQAWGRDGHRMINHLAAEHLPADVPAFLRDGAAMDLMEYLGPEPDRWRNRAEDELSATQAPDHFIDLEYADLLDTLPKRRYDFVRALEAAQPKHPEVALTPEKVGMQPWQVEEIYERLKAAMREYRGLLAAKADTRPVETVILFYAGWLGHYVADGSMPLHTSYQYNGWTGLNPHGYTTEHRIHSQFEAVYVTTNVTRQDLEPLVTAAPTKVLQDEWADYLAYLRRTGTFVEKTYQLEKAGGFTGAGTPDAKAFADERLAAGAIELRDMIDTAWVRSADPVPEYKGAQ